ncbi:MAG: hypothetical protein Alpg2KO_33530 [Alphaproteobacteria bacterium]
MQRWFTRRRGASGLTYGLIVGLISIVALTAVQTSGESVDSLLSTTAEAMGEAVEEPSPTPTPLPDPPSVSLTSTSAINTTFGSSVTLNGSATGEDVSLQWHLDGVPIDGATENELTLPSLNQDQLGAYTLVATNPGGSATSGSRTVSASLTYTTRRGTGSGCTFTGGSSFNGAAAWDGNTGTSITIENSNRTFCTCYIADFAPVRVASILTDVRFGVSTGGRTLRLRRNNGSTFTVQSGGTLSNTSSVNRTYTNPEPSTLMRGLAICYNGVASGTNARRLFVDELRVNLAP